MEESELSRQGESGQATTEHRQPGFISRSWTCREKLWKVYWLYLIVLGQIYAGIAVGIDEAIGANQQVAAALVLPYLIWAYVSLWRCSFNADTKTWGYVLRFGLVFAIPIGLSEVLHVLFVGVKSSV